MLHTSPKASCISQYVPQEEESEEDDEQLHGRQQGGADTDVAYSKLINLFASRNDGAAAQALRQRQQEQHGDSEGESDDEPQVSRGRARRLAGWGGLI